MITNKGIELMSKYLVGQVPAFVSHIAIGCGATPLIPIASHGDYSDRTSMLFEMDRLPVVSRSIINVDGVNQMVFSAQLPQTGRYGITEIGIYPAEKSNASGSVDSRMLYSFTPTEEWLTDISGTKESILLEYDRLDTDDAGNVISYINPALPKVSPSKAFFIDSDNAVFSIGARVDRHEQPRYLQNSLLVRGNMTELDSETSFPINDNRDHIQITDVDLSALDQASQAKDELKLAFSILSKEDSESATIPGRVQVVVEFTDSDEDLPTNYARLVFNETSGFSDRYKVVSSSLKDLETAGAFTWSIVNRIRIYVCVDYSADFLVALDALRFENTSGTDARYGLAGYTVAKNASTNNVNKAVPIAKNEDTASYIEFRFTLDRVSV